MAADLRGIDLRPGAHTIGMVRHYRCQHCGCGNEIRHAGLVPASFYNVLRDYVREAAGDDFVLMPVSTLNAMGEELETLRRAGEPA